jgi:acetyl-CoA carboxylase biotin carboxyl carrier protein
MDEKQILNLLNGFTASGIAELDLEQADLKLSLRRFQRQAESAPASPAQIAAVHAGMPAQAQGAPRAEGSKAEAQAPSGEIVSSPLVATFYRSAGPDSPPFAEVGKKVKAGQPLCILEAMKNMNELQADFDCEILRVLPENATLVEFGQPLFEVRRI